MKAGSFDGAESIDNQRGVTAIIERSGSEFPGIEMSAENDKLVGLFAATQFGGDIGGLNGTADMVGNREIGIELLTGGDQSGNTASVFPRQQHHREAINFAGQRVGVAIQEVVRARGLKGDGQGFRLNRTIDDGWSAQILGEKVLPGFHFLGVDEENRDRDITSFGEVIRVSSTEVDNADFLLRHEGGSPGERDGTHAKLLGGNYSHLGCAFRPGVRYGEILRVNAVCPGCFESVHTPLHGSLHSLCAGNAAADLVRELFEICVERRGLERFGDQLVRGVLCKGCAEKKEADECFKGLFFHHAALEMKIRKRGRAASRDSSSGEYVRLGRCRKSFSEIEQQVPRLCSAIPTIAELRSE